MRAVIDSGKTHQKRQGQEDPEALSVEDERDEGRREPVRGMTGRHAAVAPNAGQQVHAFQRICGTRHIEHILERAHHKAVPNTEGDQENPNEDRSPETPFDHHQDAQENG